MQNQIELNRIKSNCRQGFELNWIELNSKLFKMPVLSITILRHDINKSDKTKPNKPHVLVICKRWWLGKTTFSPQWRKNPLSHWDLNQIHSCWKVTLLSLPSVSSSDVWVYLSSFNDNLQLYTTAVDSAVVVSPATSSSSSSKHRYNTALTDDCYVGAEQIWHNPQHHRKTEAFVYMCRFTRTVEWVQVPCGNFPLGLCVVSAARLLLKEQNWLLKPAQWLLCRWPTGRLCTSSLKMSHKSVTRT